MAAVSTCDEASTLVTVILDTEDSTNLVCERVLPTLWLARVQQIRANRRAASGKTLRVEGVMCHVVEIGGHKAGTVFGVVTVSTNCQCP